MSPTEELPIPDLDYDIGPVAFTIEDLIRRGGGLRRRRIAVGGATAAVAVAGVGAAAAVFASTGTSSTDPQRVTVASGSQSPTAAMSPTTLSYPTVMRPITVNCARVMGLRKCKGEPNEGSPSAALLGVSVPDPAPGFPLRREPDSAATESLSTGGTYWADTFLVGRTPPSCTTYPGGGACSPTGPEATVIVTKGPQPTSPDAHNEIENEPVVQTTTIDGHPAYVTQDNSETVLYFSAGPFAVLVAGDQGATVNDLTTLAESIHGLQ